MRAAATVLLTLVLAAGATAQDLGVKAPPQDHPIAIVNATVHPVSGPPIEKGAVLFEGGTIRLVTNEPTTWPAGTEVIDASGKHVWPGLIAASTNLGLTEIGSVRATRDFEEVGGVKPEVRAAVAVNPDSTLIPVARTNGILTAAVFPSGGAIAGRASLMRLDGWTWEEMAIEADLGLVVHWPATRPTRAWWMEKSEEEQKKDIERNLRAIREAFAEARSYRDARTAGESVREDIRWEAMEGVFPRGSAPAARPVFFVADEMEQIRSAVLFAVERGLRPVIVGGRDAPLCAALLKEHHVPVIVNGTLKMPRRADAPYDEAYRLPARLEEAGVRWCLASGQGAANERNLPYAAAMAVAHGLYRDAAIRSMTLSVAEILGVGDRLGSVAKGKAATLIVTNGDPLEMKTRVEMAFIDGRRIDLSNKQTVLWKKYREKYRQKGLLK